MCVAGGTVSRRRSARAAPPFRDGDVVLTPPLRRRDRSRVAVQQARNTAETMTSDTRGMGPLEGFCVGITADRRAGELAELLTRRGAQVMHGPAIGTSYLGDEEALHS